MPELNIRLLDQIIIGLGFLVLVAIGIRCSRRSQTDEGYFLAGRSMPGWVVGFSLMATIVSSLTFLGLPAFAFGDANWRNVLSLFTYIPAVFVAVYLFIPFYRSMRVRSAYEYLELRFGLWARVYAAAAFVLFHFFRTGLVLYAVSLAIQSILGTDEASLPRDHHRRGDPGLRLHHPGRAPGGDLDGRLSRNRADRGRTPVSAHHRFPTAWRICRVVAGGRGRQQVRSGQHRPHAPWEDRLGLRGGRVHDLATDFGNGSDQRPALRGGQERQGRFSGRRHRLLPGGTDVDLLRVSGNRSLRLCEGGSEHGTGGTPGGRRVPQIHPDPTPRGLGRAGVDRTARVRHVHLGLQHQRHGGHRHYRLLPEAVGQGSGSASLRQEWED